MKRLLTGVGALMIAAAIFAPSLPVFAADGDITATDVKVVITGDEAGEKTPDGALKGTAAEEEGMLQITPSTLLKLKFKLEGAGEGTKMAFIANQKLADGEKVSSEKIQFIDQQTTDENGVISIQFRPRTGDAVGIYNMRANASEATMFSGFYKTLADQIQPTLTEPRETMQGSDIELTVSGYTEPWAEANKLYDITDGVQTEISAENYSFTPDSGGTNSATLKISTTTDWAVGEHSLKFIPNEAGGAYNPVGFTVSITPAPVITTYTLTLNANGGSAVNDVSFKSNEITASGISIPASDKNGYNFDGWYTALEGGDKVEKITADNLSAVFGEATTAALYAHWTPASYTITYHNVDGAENPNTASSYTIESEAITLQEPIKAGYHFRGWYTDSGFTSAITQIAAGSTGNVDLYAKWEEKAKSAVTAEFKSTSGKAISGGAVNIPSAPVQEGETVSFSVTAPKGYTISNVSYKTDGEPINLEASEGSYSFTMPAAAVTVTVTAEPVNYTIKFDLNGGTGSVSDIPATVENLPTLPKTGISNEGYDFAGWFTEAEAGSAVTNISSAEDLFALFADNETETTLYAHWTPHGKFRVAYSALGADEGTVPTDNNDYDVTTTTEIVIPQQEPTRTGYTFEGWTVDEDATVYKYGTENDSYTADFSNMSGTLTFTAKWTPVSYSITVDAQNGEAASEISGTVVNLPQLPAAPVRTGYTFKGWFDSASGGEEITAITADNLLSLNTIYAQWEEIMVTSVTVKPSSDNTVTEQNGTIQFTAEVNPATALNKDIVWSLTTENGEVVDADTATLTENGLFTALKEGLNAVFKVTALNERSGKSDTASVTVNIPDGIQYKINGADAAQSTVNVTKRTDENAWVIVALYKNNAALSNASGTLVKASLKDITDVNGANQSVEIANAFAGDYDYAIVFMWNSLNEMSPYCEAIRVNK